MQARSAAALSRRAALGVFQMLRKAMLLATVSLASNSSFAFDLGLSSSGEDLSLGVWSERSASSRVGLYMRAIADFQDHENGDEVSVWVIPPKTSCAQK